MALGDKRPVVMEADIGKSGGPAAYGHTHTAADVGAAPAGYGYGGALRYLGQVSEANLNSVLDDFISTIADDTPHQVTIWINTMSVSLCTVVRANMNYASVRGATFAGTHGVWVKYKINGTWLPLEWVNPPMLLGVEYRTTERHNGVPVYAKRIVFTPSTDFNANTTLAIPHGIDGYYAFTRLFAKSGNYPLPFYAHEGNGSFTAVRSVDATNIYISTNQNWGKGVWTIDIFYPKN